VVIAALSGPELLKHMGAHILHDIRLKDVPNACGLCLGTLGGCVIHLVTRSKVTSVSNEKSRCPNMRKFKLGVAAEFTERSPCTNHPTACPVCPPDGPAVWKYNLQSHIIAAHPTATVDLYKKHFEISDAERTLMKAAYLAKPRMSSKRVRAREGLVISEGHSTRMVMRSDIFAHLIPWYLLFARALPTLNENGAEDSSNEDSSESEEDMGGKDDESNGATGSTVSNEPQISKWNPDNVPQVAYL